MCFYGYCDEPDQYKTFHNKYSKFATEITSQFANKIGQPKDLIVAWSGNENTQDLTKLIIVFSYCSPIEIPEARKLLIKCVQEVLKATNEHKEIQPYLRDHPFTSQNITIDIVICNNDGSNTYYPNLGIVHIDNNKICYSGEDWGKHVPIQEEPYDEAVKILEKEVSKKITQQESYKQGK
jgi:hypothetical protein